MCPSQKHKINLQTPDVIYDIYTPSISMEPKFYTFQQDCNTFVRDSVLVCDPGPIVMRDDCSVAKRKMEGKLTMLQVYVVHPSVR